MILWHFGPLWGHISTPRGRKTPPILSNFKCQCQPPRLVWSASPSGYDLSRYPPVTWWGEHFFFYKVSFEKHPSIHCPSLCCQNNTIHHWHCHKLIYRRDIYALHLSRPIIGTILPSSSRETIAIQLATSFQGNSSFPIWKRCFVNSRGLSQFCPLTTKFSFRILT